ncbi:class IIb bacteriocin, lactobin A/cerein 7B family [Pseudoalteromonas sp. 2CM28B]|uniref:class IIb bacteriocin, lactobin A/cerein 7B family n=1 Tax=Pseudoalteromonas sp. 2CM28B TaxID=2929851 RepID=UPI0020BDB38A|nr:class IIb bacteriocin, lactobin A/cerein 7B family [Pseudoalteromonas sp. 2CM28B]MCK8137727.1 class IIb bacteriocin, lactobin A/cerein 7B family [Pseudoalteromonas sp. 2CM28B]
MKELNCIELKEVNGGLAFIPILIVTAASAYAGGYAWGSYQKSKSETQAPKGGCEPTC